MKIIVWFFCYLLSSTSFLFAQNVGISSTGVLPNASAALDINYTNKGLLLPRLTTNQRDLIVNPANGLMIFNVNTGCIDVYFEWKWNNITPQQNWYVDADGDGYGDIQNPRLACLQPAGTIPIGGDCNDANANIHPGALELCDAIDNDCDGLVDGNDPGLVLIACNNQAGVCQGAMRTASLCQGGVWLPCTAATYALHNTNYNFGEETACDGMDNNCDGLIDNILVAPLNSNQNGACAGSRQTCNGAGGWVNNYTSVPGYGGNEICGNGVDDNCNGQVDEGCAQARTPVKLRATVKKSRKKM